MQGSILSVHVIDARDLRPSSGRDANARVRLSIEGNRSSTQEIPGSNNPVWNEVSAFDIIHGTDKLSVQVQDVQPNRERTIIGEVEIDLRNLSLDYQRWIEMNDEGKSKSSIIVPPYGRNRFFSLLIVINGSIGLLERMKAGDFDLDMVDYNSPDPPDIDQMKKDELYTL